MRIQNMRIMLNWMVDPKRTNMKKTIWHTKNPQIRINI
jgi:hypothetical protein